jgi:hypothetical protein
LLIMRFVISIIQGVNDRNVSSRFFIGTTEDGVFKRPNY